MIEVSATVGEKALRLVEEGCVRISDATPHLAIVKGDSSWHTVIAEPSGARCDCRAWMPSRACSHSTAALIVWAEKLATGMAGASPGSVAAENHAAPVDGVVDVSPSAPSTGQPPDAA